MKTVLKNKVWPTLISITILVVSFVYLYAPARERPIPEIVKEVPQPTFFYGFPIDSFEITTGKVKRNQNLSEILAQHNISYQDLHTLSKTSRKTYDVRKLKASADYTIIHEKDSLKTARQFIFEPSPKEYVVYNFYDTIYTALYQKPIERVERTLAIEINSSMYEAILNQNSSPLLVNRLVDIFAWQVNFFRIAKGDKLKVIFEEEIVDDQIVGIGEIKVAYFEHWRKKYYAIPFSNQEKVDYFDEEGNSLRKTFLRAPLNYKKMRISSKFSLRRFHPVQKRYKAHLGTDYAAPTGTPIRTVGDGVILEAKYHGGNGNYVKIKHNSNYATQYLHMSKIAKGIRPGAIVKQGETIGYVGSTGLANGPHVCFRFWENGKQINPLKVDLFSSQEIDPNSIEQFKVYADSVKSQLDLISFPQQELLLANIKLPLPTVD